MRIRSRLFQPIIIFLSTIALLAASFTGCRSGKRLTIAVAAGIEGEALKRAALDYEAQAGIKVQVAEFPNDDLFGKELIDLNAGTGAYDLILIDDPWFPRFAESDFLTDLTPLYRKRRLNGPDDDFVPASIALCRHPYATGALYALPYVGNSQMFFYRADLFQKHALKEPATWDDVLRAAKTISENEHAGAPDGVYGYVMRATRGNASVADFLPIFWAFGAEMFDASGQPTINSAEGINALRFMLELGRYTEPGYANFGADDVSRRLLSGTAAMSINWPTWISAFSDPNRSKVIGKMAFTVMPSGTKPGRAEIGNWLIAIPRSSRNAEAAFDFLVWATSPEQMKKSALGGNPPTRRSVFNDSELVANFPTYPVQLRSLESSRERPRTPLWNEIENAFGIFLSRAASGELSAEEAMNQANAEISKIVSRER